MGNFASGLYYDIIINKEPFNRVKRDELFCYAYYFDAPDSMLINKGYDARCFENVTDCVVMNKAIMRANMDRPKSFCSTPKGRFCYLTGLPKDLLKNCAFQRQAKTYWNLSPLVIYGGKDGKEIVINDEIKYDEDTLLYALMYRGVEECREQN